MPSLPITIGELTDVPAFDSPIASPWAQEATRRIAHRFASAADRDTRYPAAVAGVGAICSIGARFYRSDGTTWIRDGEWQTITGTWQGFLFSAANVFDQHYCRVGDLISVLFVVQIGTAGNAINAAVGFDGGNLPQAAGYIGALDSWTCNYRSPTGARYAGMVTAWGTGMGFSPVVAGTGASTGAPIAAANIATGYPMNWQNGASMTIAGHYRL